MKNNNIIIPGLVTLLVLVIAFLGNMYLVGFDWNLIDFLIMGILVFSASLLIDIVITRIKTNKYRLVLSIAILLLLFYIWAELGVGIFFNLGS